jgi:hypothetical protein
MPEEYTLFLNKSYSLESQTDFPKAGMAKSSGFREIGNGKSREGNTSTQLFIESFIGWRLLVYGANTINIFKTNRSPYSAFGRL